MQPTNNRVNFGGVVAADLPRHSSDGFAAAVGWESRDTLKGRAIVDGRAAKLAAADNRRRVSKFILAIELAEQPERLTHGGSAFNAPRLHENPKNMLSRGARRGIGGTNDAFSSFR